jgi:glycosyltransferase involved in cell wall biosynthesis
MDEHIYNIRPINVMFIIYDLERGGPELRILDLAENVPSDIRIFICVTSTKHSLLDRFKRCNVEIEVIPITKAYREFMTIREVIQIVRRNKISIVNTFDVKGLLIGLFIKLFSGRQVTLIHNVVDLLHNYHIRQKIALRLLLKMVDRVISNSREAKELFGKGLFSGKRIELIHNGVDVTKFRRGISPILALRRSLNIPDHAFVIGTVANLREEKGYPFLLRAFKQLLDRYPQLFLLCVGGGPLLDDMKILASEVDVADKTIITGYVENVPDYIGLMNVFVLCSRKEGFPNALIQAMSMEVPVIATAVGGCLEIVDDAKDGFLFTPGDSDGFIEKVCQLIENSELASTVAHRAREKVKSRFTLTRMTEHYMDFFRKVAPKSDQYRLDEGPGHK